MLVNLDGIAKTLGMLPIGNVEIDMSDAKRCWGGMKGEKLSEEHRKAMSESKKGIVFSESHKANLRKSRAGRKPALGSKHSAEARAKAGAPHKGKPKSPEQRAKMAEARRAWWAKKKASE